MPSKKKNVKKYYWQTGILLAVIVALGFGVRLYLAPAEGYGFDVGVNQGWAHSAVELGLVKSYRIQLDGNMLPNYPPLSLAAFELAGLAIGPEARTASGRGLLFRIAIKIPGMMADAALCLLLFFCVRKFGKSNRAGLLAALVYALHPGVIYDTAVWGQFDALYVVFIVATFLACSRKNWLLMGICFALAILSKPHALLFAPLVLYALVPNWKGLLEVACAGLATLVLGFLPFVLGGSGTEVLRVYTHAVGYYPNITVGAYNFWWAMFADKGNDIKDTLPFFDFLSYRTSALVVFGALYAGILGTFQPSLWKKKEVTDIRMLLPVAALVMQAFFTFNVEMHERYLFPYMALGLPMLFMNGRLACMYILTSVCFYLNLVAILPYSWFDRALFNEFPLLDAFIGSAQVWLFFLTWFFLYEEQKKSIPSGILWKTKVKIRSMWKKWKTA
jgi:Gpi18-like mannosyltransferase